MFTLNEIQKVDRSELGALVPISVFRAFRHFAAGYVEKLLGEGVALIFKNAGRDLGREVGEMLYKPDFDDYLEAVIEYTKLCKIGILSLVSMTDDELVVRLDECITCAGMDNIGQRLCYFEVGFVIGIAEAFVGEPLNGRETKCNANGEETCEVTVALSD